MGLGKTLTILSYLKLIKDKKQKSLEALSKSKLKANSRIRNISDLCDDDDDDNDDDENSEDSELINTDYSDDDDDCLRTLIVVPAYLINQWLSEIKSKFERNSFSVKVYHGQDRKKISKEELTYCDIVFTSYEIVAREADQIDKDTKRVILNKSPLARIEWKRVICDEGHKIKNPLSQANHGLCSLKAKYRFDFYAIK